VAWTNRALLAFVGRRIEEVLGREIGEVLGCEACGSERGLGGINLVKF
jgi:hypothetical protein